MKRAISFVLSLVMVLGICSTMPFAKIEASAVDGSELFGVQASGFKDNKITYTVYLKKGVKMVGSIIYAKFDSQILAIDEVNTGACMTTDDYGDESQSINGEYEQGFMLENNEQYAIAHVCGTGTDYNAGSTDKPYIQFTFEAIDDSRPKTTVEFYCYEFISQSEASNNIPNGSENFIFSDTRTTLGQITIESVKSEKDGIRISWGNVVGADSYRIYKDNTVIFETSDGTTTNYLDMAVNNNTVYSYAVEAVNEASFEDANGNKYPAALSEAVSTRYTVAPSKINLSNVCGKIVVEWSKVEGATAYSVYRRIVNAAGEVSDWESLEQITGNKYSDATATAGTTYQYAVQVYSDGGYSDLYGESEIVYNGAEHSLGDWVVTLKPTCTKNGSQTKTCTVCGYAITETISATGHTEVVDVAVEATCTENGKTEGSHCSVCSAVIKAQETVPAKGHSYGDWVIEEVEACGNAGIRVKTCSACGHKISETISATGHTEVIDAAVAATCTEAGLTEGSHCSVCNAVIKAQEVVPAKGHTAVKDSAVKATCTAAGKTEGSHCSVCNEVIKEQETVSATGHKLSGWKTEKKATVNAAGKKVKKCTVCGKTIETGKIAQLKCSKPSLKKIENTADGVKITWGKVTGADSYTVYRKTGSGKYSKIATVKGNSKVTYTDKKAKSGKKYYYQVKAVNEAGESSASKAKSILYLADTTLSTPKSTKNGITLKWKKVTGAEGYQVWRKTGSGSYKKIATVKGNSKVTYTDKKAQKGKTYTYKIKAYKSKTTSAYSNTKKIKDKY